LEVRTRTVKRPGTDAQSIVPRGARKAAVKKAPRAKAKTVAAAMPKEGTKKAKLLALVMRPEGATMAEMLKMTGWQACRGTLGVVCFAAKKSLTITKGDGDEPSRWHAK
jgi:Protein of unknown function (DUF3489)